MGERRVYVAYTGGTIGMRRAERGYEPAPGYLQQLVSEHPAFRADEVPEVVVHEYVPLLDSSNMTPADWRLIALDVEDQYDDFDAFLVIHGTDTMAYTASALSFMLEGLGKPVVLTGSQVPFEVPRADAAENLLASLILCERYAHRMAEVCVCFGGRLLRGNRTKKVDAEDFAAFDSPNMPPLGRIGIDYDVRWDLLRRPGWLEGPLRVRPIGDATVAAFRLFPGLKASYLASLFEAGIDGLVLECYGSGNAPHRNADFMRVLREATEAGIVVVDVPQPLHGYADLSRYATGRALLDAGVVGGYDMTPEAALAKLAYLFECGISSDEVKARVPLDLRGELTAPASDA